MNLRRMTPEEEDRAGLSASASCGICASAEGHVCGGCRVLLLHQQGTTCLECWRLLWEETDGE